MAIHDEIDKRYYLVLFLVLFLSVMTAQWENECISLSVLSVARVMTAQWENECISPPVLSVAQILFPAEYFKRIFLADHMCCLVHGPGRTRGYDHS